MTFQQLSLKEYQVCYYHSNLCVANGNQQSCIIQKKQTHDSSVAIDNTSESSDLVMYVTLFMEFLCYNCNRNVEFHPIIYRQHKDALLTTYQSFNKVCIGSHDL